MDACLQCPLGSNLLPLPLQCAGTDIEHQECMSEGLSQKRPPKIVCMSKESVARCCSACYLKGGFSVFSRCPFGIKLLKSKRMHSFNNL